MIVKIALLALFASVAIAIPDSRPLTCGDNEYVNGCGGCDSTCETPDVACPEICGPAACRCKQGYVRGPGGKCIQQSECPAKRLRRAANVTCGENESFRQCAGCEASCDDLNPVCVRMCQKPQCQCLRGYVRQDGKCIKEEDCPARTKRDAPQQCPANERYNECAGCEATCDIPMPICTLQCRPPKCQCVQGHVRHANGTCVPAESCVKEESGTGGPAHLEPIVPINDPCAVVRCASGPCVVLNGKAVCTGNPKPETGANVDPCSTITCEWNEKCEWVQIQCFVPPCPQDPPRCVPIEKKEESKD